MLPQFHLLAAHRGDGFRQEFLELFARREALGAVNVDDISICLGEHFFSQAGPNPVGRIDGGAQGVVMFPKPVATPHAGKLVLRRSV